MFHRLAQRFDDFFLVFIHCCIDLRIRESGSSKRILSSAVSISLNVTLKSYNGTKNDLGANYGEMPSGTWYIQAQNFANTTVGKTVSELENLSTDKIEGSCSIYTGGYKATIVRAAGYAR